MGGDAEKLLTLEEAARRLSVTPVDVEQMIQRGQLAGFRLGGHLLRVRLADVERLLEARPGRARGAPSRAQTAARRRPPANLWDRVMDFFYFNDFYLVALLLLLTLLALILTL